MEADLGGRGHNDWKRGNWAGIFLSRVVRCYKELKEHEAILTYIFYKQMDLFVCLFVFVTVNEVSTLTYE